MEHAHKYMFKLHTNPKLTLTCPDRKPCANYILGHDGRHNIDIIRSGEVVLRDSSKKDVCIGARRCAGWRHLATRPANRSRNHRKQTANRKIGQPY